MRFRRTLISVFTLCLFAAAPAQAEDPPFVAWTSLLPPLTTGYDPSSEDLCLAGKEKCVDAVIREMTKRFDPLAKACDHDAVFALTYLRTTEEYKRAIQDPTFFEDTRFVNHEDAVFAAYYFDAYDAWHGGRRETVPKAWRVAFEAADKREVSAAGNLFLGINAHVQRDLAFVLYGIGMVKPDGSSRKRDHDKVNEFLNRVSDEVIPEIARRFDPTIDDGDLPTTLDNMALFQVIPTWREIAWRNAERLAEAPNAATRAMVAQEIEDYAASQATALRESFRYWLGKTSAERDAYCAMNQG